MPSTKHRLNLSDYQALPTRRDEEIELARVYLELNTRVQPTWGWSVEPDAYITDLEGEILVSREGAGDELRVETVCAHSVHLGEADEDGVPWFDILDAHSADTAMYIDLFDAAGSCYSQWVESTLEPFGSDLLILDRIRIKPEYRGNGYGLYAAQLMITGFACNGVVACVPAPYELLEKVPRRVPGTRTSNRGRQIPGWTAAEAELGSRHRSLLGFERVPKFRSLRCVADHSPSLDAKIVIRKYLAVSTRGDRTLRSMPEEPIGFYYEFLALAAH